MSETPDAAPPTAVTDLTDVPPTFQPLVMAFGPALPVEAARNRWGKLTAAAENGTITLVTRERWEWAAVVPLTEVAEPVPTLTAWPLSAAKAKLGDLVRMACMFPGEIGGPQILTRHRRPIAAVISARTLVDRPPAAARLAAVDLLLAGHTITLRHDPGEAGSSDEHGDVLYPPEPEYFEAIAHDHAGAVVAQGYADTMHEALLRLAPPRDPYTDPDGEIAGMYDTEPPF